MRLLGYYVSEGFTNEQGIFNFGSHEELIEETKSYVKKVFGFGYYKYSPSYCSKSYGLF